MCVLRDRGMGEVLLTPGKYTHIRRMVTIIIHNAQNIYRSVPSKRPWVLGIHGRKHGGEHVPGEATFIYKILYNY